MTTLNPPARTAPRAPAPVHTPPARLSSQALLQHARCIEIEHEGKIYELRVTRLGKLILTA